MRKEGLQCCSVVGQAKNKPEERVVCEGVMPGRKVREALKQEDHQTLQGQERAL